MWEIATVEEIDALGDKSGGGSSSGGFSDGLDLDLDVSTKCIWYNLLFFQAEKIENYIFS